MSKLRNDTLISVVGTGCNFGQSRSFQSGDVYIYKGTLCSNFSDRCSAQLWSEYGHTSWHRAAIMSSLDLWQITAGSFVPTFVQPECKTCSQCQAGHRFYTRYFRARRWRKFCGSLSSSSSRSFNWLPRKENSIHNLELGGDVVSYCQLIDGELSCLSWCCWILFLTWWHLTGPGHEEDLGWGMTTEDRHINLGKYEAAVKRKKILQREDVEYMLLWWKECFLQSVWPTFGCWARLLLLHLMQIRCWLSSQYSSRV